MASFVILFAAIVASLLTLLMVMGAREPAFFFVTAGTATTGTATTGTAKARPVTTKPVAGSLTTEPVGIYDLDLYNSGALGQNPNRTFHSSKIVAPKFGINIWDAEHLRAHSLPFLFLTATEPDSSASPFILNATDLSLVWADTTTHRDAAMNFRPQTYRGEKFLSFWEGINASGRGNGVCVLYDQSYQERYRVTAKDLGFGADLHECKLTHDGTALITVYNLVQYNLTGVGGQDYDQLLDCYFQEIDVETGDVLFSWAASDWFSPKDSYEQYKPNYDFFHLNSVQKVSRISLLFQVPIGQSLTLICTGPQRQLSNLESTLAYHRADCGKWHRDAWRANLEIEWETKSISRSLWRKCSRFLVATSCTLP